MDRSEIPAFVRARFNNVIPSATIFAQDRAARNLLDYLESHPGQGIAAHDLRDHGLEPAPNTYHTVLRQAQFRLENLWNNLNIIYQAIEHLHLQAQANQGNSIKTLQPSARIERRNEIRWFKFLSPVKENDEAVLRNGVDEMAGEIRRIREAMAKANEEWEAAARVEKESREAMEGRSALLEGQPNSMYSTHNEEIDLSADLEQLEDSGMQDQDEPEASPTTPLSAQQTHQNNASSAVGTQQAASEKSNFQQTTSPMKTQQTASPVDDNTQQTAPDGSDAERTASPSDNTQQGVGNGGNAQQGAPPGHNTQQAPERRFKAPPTHSPTDPIPASTQALADIVKSLPLQTKKMDDRYAAGMGFPSRQALRKEKGLQGEISRKTGGLIHHHRGGKLVEWDGDLRLFPLQEWWDFLMLRGQYARVKQGEKRGGGDGA